MKLKKQVQAWFFASDHYV